MKLIFHKRAATNQRIFPAHYVMQFLVKQKVSNLCTNFPTHHQQGAMQELEEQRDTRRSVFISTRNEKAT